MLAVSGLTKVFGGFTAVNSVSFEVKEGEILGLIGPNGSGKTTTFNLIAGTLAPTAGSIRFEGREIAGLPAHRVCRLGLARTRSRVRFASCRCATTSRCPPISPEEVISLTPKR